MVHDSFSELPAIGAWRLTGAYSGFEVTRFAASDAGRTLRGTTLGVEDDLIWSIEYTIHLDANWQVMSARIESGVGARLEVATDGAGNWTVNGEHRPDLRGYVDLDLEASAVTNTIAVHRLALPVGGTGQSRAAYVRTAGLVVERLDQTYRRLANQHGLIVFDYESPRFGYRGRLHFAKDGLIVEYPEIAERVKSQLGSPIVEG
jgi:hypothetical protein